MSKRHFAVALCLGLSSLVLGTEGFAQTAEESAPKAAASEQDLSPEQKAAYDTHLEAGKKAYASQDYDSAYRELSTAHAIFPNPAILFNLGLISERGGALEQASTHYENYIAAPGVSLEDRQRASERLKAVREILATTSAADRAKAQEEQSNLMPALEAMGIEEMPTGEQASNDGVEVQPEETPPETVDAPEEPYTWPVYAAFGTATVAVAGGVAMLLMANGAIDDGKAAGQAGDDLALAAAEEDASTYATAATGLFAGGVVMAVVGTVYAVKNSMVEAAPQAAVPADHSPQVTISIGKDFFGPILTTKF